ncbi:dehydrogenase [Bradyrhizobium oligotrophicum S58]|uniref:Dehydrogenase n=1 Tax=Bradyrhizobium oligotrophicum S58 TaxID=1245469 RepID=M4Z5Y1_9BRAD|nr:hypothetical protein [Bradyrhizobium oligotrophicum]BAM88918.1 dehydrogenase [Bradyrhizobium oligotrophicum S58]
MAQAIRIVDTDDAVRMAARAFRMGLQFCPGSCIRSSMRMKLDIPRAMPSRDSGIDQRRVSPGTTERLRRSSLIQRDKTEKHDQHHNRGQMKRPLATMAERVAPPLMTDAPSLRPAADFISSLKLIWPVQPPPQKYSYFFFSEYVIE